MLKCKLITLYISMSEIQKGLVLVDQNQDTGRSMFSWEVQRRTTLLFQLSEAAHALDPQHLPLHASPSSVFLVTSPTHTVVLLPLFHDMARW